MEPSATESNDDPTGHYVLIHVQPKQGGRGTFHFLLVIRYELVNSGIWCSVQVNRCTFLKLLIIPIVLQCDLQAVVYFPFPFF